MTPATELREKLAGAMDDRSSVRLWLRLLTCTSVIEKRLKRRFAERHDTTLPRFDVMAALDRNPDGITMGQLSQALLVSNGNVTGVVQAMLRENHVSLTPSPSDGRASIVRLTAQGRECFGEQAESHHQWVEGMFEGMSRDERTALYALLGVLKASLSSDTGEDKS